MLSLRHWRGRVTNCPELETVRGSLIPGELPEDDVSAGLVDHTHKPVVRGGNDGQATSAFTFRTYGEAAL